MRTRHLVLIACAGLGGGAWPVAVTAAPAATPSSSAAPTAAVSKTNDASKQYTLVGGDRLTVSVTGQSDLNRSVSISAAGTIALQLIDDPVKLAGMTVAQAEDEIEKQYVNNRILRRPQVIITVEQTSARYVYVQGETNKKEPILYPMDTGKAMTLVEAIQKAGVTTDARLGKVKVLRKKADGTIETLGPFDVESFMSGKTKNQQINIDLQPDDTIDVPIRII